MISFSSSGSWDRTEKFTEKCASGAIFRSLSAQADLGTTALSRATPRETGLASSSWTSQVRRTGAGWQIDWLNGNVEGGFHVAISLQYGHGTGTGGYVRGQDYINPAMKPVFDQIAQAVWREVMNA